MKFAIKDHEKFKNISSGIQSLMIGISIMVGGIWTLIEFQRLYKSEIALLEVEEKIDNLKKLETEKISIDYIEIADSTAEKSGLIIQCTFENMGEIPLECYKPYLRVTKVDLFQKPSFKATCDTILPMGKIGEMNFMIREKATETINFQYVVEEGETYLLEFQVFEFEQNSLDDLREGKNVPDFWYSSKVLSF